MCRQYVYFVAVGIVIRYKLFILFFTVLGIGPSRALSSDPPNVVPHWASDVAKVKFRAAVAA